jgi:hypothetical protein
MAAAHADPRRTHGLGIVFLGVGITFLAVGAATQRMALLTAGPSMVALGIVFIASARRRPR